jgi:hypothetical protein
VKRILFFSRNYSGMNRCNFVFRKLITNAENLDEYEYVNGSRVAGVFCRTENYRVFYLASEEG